MNSMCRLNFLRDASRRAERAELLRQLRANHRLGVYRALQGVIGRAGIAGQLNQIRLPTLVVVARRTRPHRRPTRNSCATGSPAPAWCASPAPGIRPPSKSRRPSRRRWPRVLTSCGREAGSAEAAASESN
jgi:hypothetical protein